MRVAANEETRRVAENRRYCMEHKKDAPHRRKPQGDAKYQATLTAHIFPIDCMITLIEK